MIPPFVAVAAGESPSALVGGGAALAIGVKAWIWWQAELFGMVLGNGETRLAVAGGHLAGRYHLSSTFAIGGGALAGGLSADNHDHMLSSPFVGPVLIPASYWFSCCHLEGRVALLWSDTVAGSERAFRPTAFLPYLTLRYGLSVAPAEGRW